jgi:hypothetical protein
MKGISVILGMDWLSNMEPLIDCGDKTASISNLTGGRIVYQEDKYTQIEVVLLLNTLRK